MRKLILLLIAFIAVVTFIRAYEKADAQTMKLPVQAAVEVE
jgi:hypothetical protein